MRGAGGGAGLAHDSVPQPPTPWSSLLPLREEGPGMSSRLGWAQDLLARWEERREGDKELPIPCLR